MAARSDTETASAFQPRSASNRRGAAEVHVLDDEVGRHDEVGRQHGRVVADAERHARAGVAQGGRQPRDQIELAHLAAMAGAR